LAKAAYIAADVTGDLTRVSQLLGEAGVGSRLGRSLPRATAAALALLSGEGDIDTAHRLLVGSIEAHAQDDATDVALVEALYTLLLVCYWGGRADLWVPFERAIDRLPTPIPATLSLGFATGGDPVRTAAPALRALEAEIATLHESADPAHIVRVGIAALYVDRLAGCREALWRVVKNGRTGGAVASAIQALLLLFTARFQAGEWDEAEQAIDECHELCNIHGYRLRGASVQWGRAQLAAARGHPDASRALTDDMIRWAAPRGARAVELCARHVLALAALGRSDFEDAYRHASAVTPAGEFASHLPLAV
jgi:hypothetical protein